MMPLEIAPKIYDVGVVDWAVRDFHGYKTERGASYNSYLIMDEKICLIDTVKAMFAEELLAKIERVVDPGKIDYVIVNHVEPDHAGSKRLRMLSFLLQLKGRRKQFVIMVIYMIFRS
jgi:anaerobic nitric oxide reductase flavorubredoxin